MEFNISHIGILIVFVYFLVKSIRDSHQYTHYTVPAQLLQLVRQAHLGTSRNTLWDIEVSDEMRTAHPAADRRPFAA